MMKFMMQKMMPMMKGSMESLSFDEKENMMDSMMPHMMKTMTTEEKLKIMKKMMPTMMEGMTGQDMALMMQSMIPLMMKDKGMMEMCKSGSMMKNMMETMHEKDINMINVMQTMMPKCIQMATKNASDIERQVFKDKINETLADL